VATLGLPALRTWRLDAPLTPLIGLLDAVLTGLATCNRFSCTCPISHLRCRRGGACCAETREGGGACRQGQQPSLLTAGWHRAVPASTNEAEARTDGPMERSGRRQEPGRPRRDPVKTLATGVSAEASWRHDRRSSPVGRLPRDRLAALPLRRPRLPTCPRPAGSRPRHSGPS
jgi:hypothetical protein